MTNAAVRREDSGADSPARDHGGARYVGVGVIVAIVGYLAALWLLSRHEVEGGYRLASGFNVLSGILVVTLALERLLEPVRRLLGPDTEVKKEELVEASVAARTASAPVAASPEMARKQAEINAARRQTSLLMWGLATGAGFIVAAAANTLFLHAIAAPGLALSDLPPAWFDLLLTGLVVGSGTKPVHDLVSRIEKSKTTAEDKAVRAAADTGTSSGPA